MERTQREGGGVGFKLPAALCPIVTGKKTIKVAHLIIILDRMSINRDAGGIETCCCRKSRLALRIIRFRVFPTSVLFKMFAADLPFGSLFFLLVDTNKTFLTLLPRPNARLIHCQILKKQVPA